MQSAASQDERDRLSLKRRGITLGLLTSAYFFSHVDRQILSILQEQIRADMHLTDTQLGLMAGFAFAIFYATLGIPVARLADRSNRINIVAIALALWSVMTAVGGLAQNFTQLLLARIGVGIGEAGSSPPSHSIISDLYPPEERAGAMSLYSLGIVLGGGLGVMIGGLVAHYFGWRVAMFTVGLPGLVLALIIKLLVKEPRRGLSDPDVVISDTDKMPSIWEGFRSIFADKAARHIIFGIAIAAVIGYGNGAFVPSFLQRSLGMDLMQIALIFAPAIAIIGGFSAVLGGWLANRLAQRYDIYAQCYLIVFVKALAMLPTFAAYLSNSPYAALGWLMLDTFLTSSYLGTSFGILQSLAPIRLRALWASITLLVINLVGMGIGPTAVGLMSEAFKPHYGVESLRYAMIVMVALTPWLLLHYYMAGRALKQRSLVANEAAA